MGKFEAIPQTFNGFELDSQLEKGHAAFMDYWHWDVEHEPEGYREGKVWYRPDFLLHHVNIIDIKKPCQSIYDVDVFIEVKGDPKRLKEAYERARMMQRNGFHVLIVGKFPYGANDKEIIQNLKRAGDTYWENCECYSTYTLFLARRQCGGTSSERTACEESFLREPNPGGNYDSAIWNGYYRNLKEFGLCPKAPKIMTNKFLWAGRNGEPIIGNWHTRSDRADGDPGNTVEAIKYAHQIMNYKVKKGGIQDGN